MSDNQLPSASEDGVETLLAMLFERDNVDTLRNIKFFVDESCVTKLTLAQTAATYIDNRISGEVKALSDFPEALCPTTTAEQLMAELAL